MSSEIDLQVSEFEEEYDEQTDPFGFGDELWEGWVTILGTSEPDDPLGDWPMWFEFSQTMTLYKPEAEVVLFQGRRFLSED